MGRSRYGAGHCKASLILVPCYIFTFAPTDFTDIVNLFFLWTRFIDVLLISFFPSTCHYMGYFQCPNCGNDFQIFK